jgi:hypothetical protein
MRADTKAFANFKVAPRKTVIFALQMSIKAFIFVKSVSVDIVSNQTVA